MTILTKAKPLPKHAQISRALLDKIARGDLPPGSLVPTERELVRQFGVSQQTVIRSLNDLRSRGIIRRHRGKGTYVEEASVRESLIGILHYHPETRNWRTFYIERIAEGLMRGLQERGETPRPYHTFGNMPKGDIEASGQKVVEDARRSRLRCLIVVEGYDADKVETALAPWGVPVIGSHQEQAISRYNFGFMLNAAMEAGITHLLQRGVRKIAVIGTKGTHIEVPRHITTYLKLMEQHRLSIRPGWIRVESDPDPRSGYLEFKRLWAIDERPEAVLIFDDVIAMGVTRAMVELGVRVPHDLRVMVLMSRGSGLVYPVPIDALEVDPDEVSAPGVALALQLLRGQRVERPHEWIDLTPRIYEVSDLEKDWPPAPAVTEPVLVG